MLQLTAKIFTNGANSVRIALIFAVVTFIGLLIAGLVYWIEDKFFHNIVLPYKYKNEDVTNNQKSTRVKVVTFLLNCLDYILKAIALLLAILNGAILFFIFALLCVGIFVWFATVIYYGIVVKFL